MSTSTSSTSVYFLEETDFSVLLARSTAGSRPVRIEALQEVPLTDAEALNTAARTIFSSGSGPVLCAIRPKSRLFHLATPEEASRHPGLAGAQKFGATHEKFSGLPPTWFLAAQSRDGAVPGAKPWLLQLASAVSRTSTLATLESSKLTASRNVSASLNTVGALIVASATPVWLLEIGELATHALLVSRSGVLAAGAVSLNADRIAEAVQTELGLKFRGSALKLFFNPDYDFSEAGQKIAVRLAATLQPELAALRGATAAPEALVCAGLPAGQSWFGLQLATALGLTSFTPDLKTVGVACAGPEIEASLSPAWLGFLRLIATSGSEASTPWLHEWLKIDAPLAVAASTGPAAAPVKSPATIPVAPVVLPAKALSSAPVAAPAVAAPKTIAPSSSANRTVTLSKPSASESAVSYPPKPTAIAKITAAPPSKKVEPSPQAPKITPAPVAVAQPPRVVAPAVTKPVESSGASSAFYKKPLVLIAAVVVVLGAAAGFFYTQSQKQETARLAEVARLTEEKRRTDQLLQAAAEKTLLAQKQAEAEIAARKKLEVDSSQKLAETEAGLMRAENEARTQLAARLANARGALVVATEPAGATVTIANLPTRTSPATFADIKIGKYPVLITLPHYDDVKLELEVKENNTTESGVIPLVHVVGSLVLTTEPADAAFDFHPANSVLVAPGARRTGKTPATLTDLDPGDYAVTFTRDGWVPHTETVSVARNATARAAWTFPNGVVKITSSPAGVTVTRDGVKLGVTPLTLNEPPGAARYVLTASGWDPATLSGNVQGGATLELNAQFAEAERVFNANELDRKPEPINPTQPEVPYALTVEKGRVDFQVTINRDGTIRDLVVVSATNRELVKYCQAAVSKWKFRPAMKGGKPVAVRVLVPIVVTPPNS